MTSIETGCPYSVKIGSLVATFNQPSDGNYVGYVDDVTGLDMYEVRENAQNIPGGDGGYHGPFWRGRRPWTLAGFIMPTTPVLARDQSQDKLESVIGGCFRNDGILNWTPADGIQRGVSFRTQQPIRYTKGQSNVQRRFLISGVTRDWRVLTWAQTTVQATVGAGALPLAISCTNNGTAEASPILTVTGPITTPVITNLATGKKMTFVSGVTVAAGNTLVIDLTQTYPTVLYAGSDWSNNVDPLNSDWTIAVGPNNVWGVNNFQLSGTGGSSATGLKVAWNDSWH